MSLEKSIKRLTEVIQARKPLVGPYRDDEPQPEIFGPPDPLEGLPPIPKEGWQCYWALKRMQNDTNKLKDCCTLPRDVPRCYSRRGPGDPINIQ